jgi:hypothetical protein
MLERLAKCKYSILFVPFVSYEVKKYRVNNGATIFSITTFSITINENATLSIMTLNSESCYAECHLC